MNDPNINVKTSHAPVVVEQTFNTSNEQVWAAITEVDQMTQWFFENIPAFKPEVGFETQFVVKNEDRAFTHLWKITEVISNQKITYNWRYEEYSGDSDVTFELVEEEGQTRLKLTHTVTDSFPQDIPEFERKSGVEGWGYFINSRLKEYLLSQTKI